MSKISLYSCDVCDDIVKHCNELYTNSMVYELCDNCYKDIRILEDMKHIHNIAISEMKEKKILFKYENGTKICEIDNINQEELLVFICEMLESLIQKNIVTRDVMLTAINMCLTLGTALSKESFEDKEIKNLLMSCLSLCLSCLGVLK